MRIAARVLALTAASALAVGGLSLPARADGVPAVPVITSITDPVNTSNDTAIAVSGTSDPSVTIHLSVDTVTMDATADSGGAWTVPSLDVSTLTDGTITATATADDGLGGVSAPSDPKTATKDTVAPTLDSSAPVDGTTVKPPSTISMTFSEPISAGTITVPGVPGSTVVSGSTATFTPDSPIAEGPHTANASVTDANGNDGTGSISFTADAGPDITGLAAPDVSTGHLTTTVTGTSRAPGDSVAITVTDGTHPVSHTVISGTGGHFTSAFDTSGMVDGALSVDATATDTAGISGTPAGITIFKDTGSPAITNLGATKVRIGHLTSTITGTLESGATVAISATDGTATVSGSTTAANGSFSTALALGGLADGTITITATPTDTLGNVGAPVSTATTKDTIAPTLSSAVPAAGSTVKPPGTITMTFSEPLSSGTITVSGVSGSTSVSGSTATFTRTSPIAEGPHTANASVTDANGNDGTGSVSFTVDAGPDITGLAAPDVSTGHLTTTVTGTSRAAGDSVAITVTDGSHPVSHTVTSGAGGSFTSAFNTSGMADGALSVAATATDTAGISGTPAGITISKDTGSPAITNLGATKVWIGHLTSTITGFLESGATVAISATDGTTTVSGSTTAANGSFSKALALGGLADGTITITATPTDTLGNVGAPVSTATTKDTVAPTLSSAVPAAGSTVKPPGTIAMTFSEPLSSGTITVSGVSGSTSVSGSTATFTPDSPIAEGPHTANASVTDANGNDGTGSVSFTVDAGPGITGLAAPDVNASHLTTRVTGTSRAVGDSVAITVTDGSHPVSHTVVSGAGRSFTADFDTSAMADGALSVNATATDTAGISGTPAGITIAKDTGLPAITGLGATKVRIGHLTSTITGFLESGATVAISATNGTATPAVTGTATAANGTFSKDLNLSSLADGTITIVATPTDVPGNAGAPVSTTTTKDTHAPTATVTATSTTVAHQISTVSGTCSEPSAIALTANDNDGATAAVTSSATCGAGRTWATQLNLSTLKNGPIHFSATPTDVVGNPGTPVTTTAGRTSTKLVTTVALSAPPAKVLQGTIISLTGVLTRGDAAVTKGKVRISGYYDDGRLFFRVLIPTNAAGRFTQHYQPQHTATYTAAYLGDAGNTSAVTAGRRTQVAVRFTVNPGNGPASAVAIIRGTVGPNRAGQVVSLYNVSSTGVVIRITTTRCARNSAYSFSIRLSRGHHVLQVKMGPTPGNAAGSRRFIAVRT